MSAELIRAPEPVGEGALAGHPRQLTDGFGRSFPYLRLSSVSYTHLTLPTKA